MARLVIKGSERVSGHVARRISSGQIGQGAESTGGTATGRICSRRGPYDAVVERQRWETPKQVV